MIHEYERARVLPDEDGRPYALLPKGKRTHGVRIDRSNHVLVK